MDIYIYTLVNMYAHNIYIYRERNKNREIERGRERETMYAAHPLPLQTNIDPEKKPTIERI